MNKQELAKYAESEKPYESCAILVGNETDENWTVKELILTENTAKSRGYIYNFTGQRV